MSITIDEKLIKGINIDKKEVIKIQDAKTLNILTPLENAYKANSFSVLAPISCP